MVIGCSVEGCNGKHSAKGLCKKHYEKMYQKKYRERLEVKEYRREYSKEYRKRPEARKRAKEHRQKPEIREKNRLRAKVYYQKSGVKERMRAYYRKPKQRKYRKEYAQRPHTKELVRKYHANRRKVVLEYYGGVPTKCACCGESRIEFLSIDHINGGGSKHRKELKIFGIRFNDWLIKNNYPEGYRILCHNCNQSLGFYGYCPHERERIKGD